MSEDNSSFRAIERHLQTGMLAILAGVTGWFGLTVQESTVKLATISERLAGLERQLESTKDQAYTARDAQKDLQIRDITLAALAVRVAELENSRRR